MVRALYRFRNYYFAHTTRFVIAFSALFVILYFIPNVSYVGNRVRFLHGGKIGSLFNLLFNLPVLLEFRNASDFWMTFSTLILPTYFTILMLSLTVLSYKFKKLLPLAGIGLAYLIDVQSNNIIKLNFHRLTVGSQFCIVFYMILIVATLVFLIALAFTIYVKESSYTKYLAVQPSPKRPSKAERIAKLERQVAELKQKDAD